MKIDVEEVLEALQERRRINAIDLRYAAIFIKNGKVVPVSVEEREKFAFTGLSNTDFVANRLWPDD